jgi:hypothetical protein
LSIVTADAVVVVEGPLFPETSETEFAPIERFSVPSEHMSTVTEMVVPDEEDGVNVQPVALPALFEKSLEIRPLMDSLKVTVNVVGIDRTGELGEVMATVGADVSIVIVVAVEATPALPDESLKTEVTVQTPSVKPVREHEPVEEDTEALHVTVVTPSVAEKSKDPVASDVEDETDKVVRFVFESDELTPTSELADITGATEALGAVRSIVSVVPV